MVFNTFLLNHFLSPKPTRLKSKLIKRINKDNERRPVSTGSEGEKCKTSALVPKTRPSTFYKESLILRMQQLQP